MSSSAASGGRFTTPDIDALVPHSNELLETLAALGFERRGREWVLPGYDVVFEAPGNALEPGDRPDRVSLRSGRSVLVLSIEDALLWRLREWIHWASPSGFRQAAYLLGADRLDGARLDQRARDEGLSRALAALRDLVARIDRGESIPAGEIRDRARQVASDRYIGNDETDA